MADPGTVAILAVQFGSVDHQIRARSQAIVQAPAVQCQTVQQQMPQLAPVSGAFQTGHSSEPEILHPVPSEANPAPSTALAFSLAQRLCARSFAEIVHSWRPQSGQKLGRFRKWNGTKLYRGSPNPMGCIGTSASRNQCVVWNTSSQIAIAGSRPWSHSVRRNNGVVRGKIAIIRIFSLLFLGPAPCGLVCGRGNPDGPILRRVMRVGNLGEINTTPRCRCMDVQPTLPLIVFLCQKIVRQGLT